MTHYILRIHVPRRPSAPSPSGGHVVTICIRGLPNTNRQTMVCGRYYRCSGTGLHVSALVTEAMHQLNEEVGDKVKNGQSRLVAWDSIKHNPPKQLKVSPIAMIPHKSRGFRAILDLAFSLRLACGRYLMAVNEGTTKLAPQGAIDQMGHSLWRIIHAFAEASDD